VLLVGGNAQGKTSLLEAVYYLATFISFHASHERQLINMTAGREPLAVARIVADFHREPSSPNAPIPLGAGTHRLEVRLIQEINGLDNSPRLRKEILLDGVKRKVGEAMGAFNAVLFLPQMVNIVEGPPEERRRYLNLALSQVKPHYAAMHAEYHRVLTQRNALLKALAERTGNGQYAADQLEYWDEQLAQYGAQLIQARIQAVQELERLAARIHRDLTRSQEVLRLDYQPSYDPLPERQGQLALPLKDPVDRSSLPLEKIQRGYIEQLRRLRPEEIARGVTTIGPHRDELRLLSNRIDLGIYGSRGQNRTAVLSLKLAEVAWIKEKSSQWPVLLLDEVLAELDPERRADLLTRLLECEQSLLSTTDMDSFPPSFAQHATIWNIQGGRIL
jgi:DNA replication and repair protein RecF